MDELFDVDFYRTINNDLCNLTDEQLLYHYNNYGKNEGRFGTKKEMLESINCIDFDCEFYRTIYEDLITLSDNQIVYHYVNYGKNEGRIGTKKEMLETINCTVFDCDFYRSVYDDSNNLSDNRLVYNYVKYGKNEGRFATKKEMLESINRVDFDLDFYRLINPSFANLEDNVVMTNYNKFIKNNDNYNYVELSDIDFCGINNNIRHIRNYHEIVQNFNNECDNICNKETFLNYYKDFDFEYYRTKYLKNTEFSDFDVLIHYHTVGRKQQHSYNNTITIIIYSCILITNCGGIVVMHNLAKLINDLNIPNVRAKIINPFNIKYKNQFCEDFANIHEINDNCIVIYPEIISGNPLNANNVVRWILLELGSEMPKDHYKNWNKTDLVYHWEPVSNIDDYFKQLSYPWFNPVFKNNNDKERFDTCYLMKKSFLFHKNINLLHPDNAIELNDYTNYSSSSYIEHITIILNKCKYFYSYDPNTAYILFSAICGCIPIVYPIEGIDKQTYLQTRITNCGGKLYDFIAYGNSESELINAEKQLKNINEIINSITEYYLQNVIKFIEEMKQFSLNKNTVALHYFSFDYICDYGINNLYDFNNKDKIYLFEEYKTYFSTNNIEYYDDYYKLENHENYFRWIKESLESGCVSIKSPNTGNKISTDKYFVINVENYYDIYKNDYSICNYYFEEENLVLGIGLGTVEGLETKILYLVSLNTGKIYYNWRYDKNAFENNVFKNIINLVDNINTVDFTKFEKKNITHFNILENLGHHVFNEMTGLFILNYFSLENNIDTILIGTNDFFYIDKFFDKNKIKFIKDNKINIEYGKGILFKYNHYFISNKCVDFIKFHIKNCYKHNEELFNEIKTIRSCYPIINITLRINRRNTMLNQSKVISEVINRIVTKYPNAYFFLDGYCKNNRNGNENNDEIIKYNNLVEDIKKNIKTKNHKSLINFEIGKLLEYYNICTYSIYQTSSICCLSSWLCNIDGLQFGRKNIKIYEKIDKNIKQYGAKINYLEENILYHNSCYEISSDTIMNLLPDF